MIQPLRDAEMVLAGIRLHALRGGVLDGPPLLMLHGVTRRARDFAPLFPHLLNEWNVTAPDLRGHGASTGGQDRYLVADHADDVARIVARAEEPVVIYGHSLGAMIALSVASQLPRIVRAIVLEDPPFQTMGERIGETPWRELFSKMQQLCAERLPVAALAGKLGALETISNGRRVLLSEVRDAAALRFHASCLSQMDPEVLSPVVAGRWLSGFDVSATASGVRCPVLILQADVSCGGALTDDDAQMLKQSIADCSVVRIAGCGHQMHWDATQKLMPVVAAFLESLSAFSVGTAPRHTSSAASIHAGNG